MDVLRDAADRLGVILSRPQPLAGSMSGSVVVAGRAGRHGDVVLKVTSHDRPVATAAAGRELAAYTELAGAAIAPELLAAHITADWTAIVLRRYEPMPPADDWTDQDWLSLATVLADLHERPPPAVLAPWDGPVWRGLDPVAERSGLERLWRSPETAEALEVVVASLPELIRAAGTAPPSFVHGDCHTGNVLRAGPRLLLTDWQGSRIAPGSNDLAFLLTRAIPSASQPPRARMLERYCSLRGLPREEVAHAVLAEQLLVLALQYPAFADHLDPTAIDRLGRAFTVLAAGVDQP